jgi:hypothetical protein
MNWSQRAVKRRTLIFYLEVWDHIENRLAGRIGDLTEKGMMLLSDTEMTPETTHAFNIRIPAELGLAFEEIPVVASVQWVRPDKNPSVICIGCKFADLPSEISEQIQWLIDRMGFADIHSSKRLPFSGV